MYSAPECQGKVSVRYMNQCYNRDVWLDSYSISKMGEPMGACNACKSVWLGVVCVCVCVCVCARARLHVCINICTLYLWKTEINMITSLCNHCDIDSSPPLRPPCLTGSWTDRQSWRHSCVFPAALSPTISVMPLSSKPPVPNKYILQTGNRITLDWYNNTNSYRYLEINNNKKHRPPPPKKKRRQKRQKKTQ